jgi:hypothetical protein
VVTLFMVVITLVMVTPMTMSFVLAVGALKEVFQEIHIVSPFPDQCGRDCHLCLQSD